LSFKEAAMKVRITTDIDMSTGHYEVRIQNVTSPGSGVDSEVLRLAWRKVYDQLVEQLEVMSPEAPN
jgi:hypothetical protein